MSAEQVAPLVRQVLAIAQTFSGGMGALVGSSVGLAAALAVATLVSEDLACVAAGWLAARGQLGLGWAVLGCGAGIFAGDLALYAAGRAFGHPVVRRAPVRWLVTPAALERAATWFGERGVRVVLASRFIPGTRLPTYVAAGALRAPLAPFATWLLLGAGLWTPLLVGAAAIASRSGHMLPVPSGTRALVAAVAALGAWIAVRGGLALRVHDARRRVLARWRRIRRWEYWPAWLLYAPVALDVLRHGLRHRSLTLFTAANPAIPTGGLVGESKAAILGALPTASRDGVRAARGELLPGTLAPGARLDRVRAFLGRHGMRYPVVLKPDVGERGADVVVVRTEREAAAYLSACSGDVLLQEYVPGLEFGVFWVRRPDESHGRVASITAKELPAVTGDGRRTVTQLVLDDDRHLAMASVLLRAQGDAATRVPAPEERVSLGDRGNHSRGALFHDATALRTPALEHALDRLGHCLPGFHFGRYDLRAPSIEALQAGTDLVVLELNGVAAEMTHIYDPHTSLFAAWRTLRAQWHLAFEIGALNRRRGARPSTVAELLDAWRRRHRPCGSASTSASDGTPRTSAALLQHDRPRSPSLLGETP